MFFSINNKILNANKIVCISEILYTNQIEINFTIYFEGNFQFKVSMPHDTFNTIHYQYGESAIIELRQTILKLWQGFYALLPNYTYKDGVYEFNNFNFIITP